MFKMLRRPQEFRASYNSCEVDLARHMAEGKYIDYDEHWE